ncbi:MAG: acyl-CoA thioester hydrolase [Phenylobacterium sp.]|jgi:acyl-CoA thioester hydrolase
MDIKAQSNQLSHQRSDYVYFFPITTRWMDNDMFGHINNVNYYSYFDTAVNQFLIEYAGFNPATSEQIGYIVASNCQYLSPLAHPEQLLGGVRVNRLGNSSVEYGVAIFKADQLSASAVGQMTHVFVDRISEKPSAIVDTMRNAMTLAQLPSTSHQPAGEQNND